MPVAAAKEGIRPVAYIASIISSHVAKLHASNEALATNLSSLEYTNDRITNLLDRSSLDTTTKTISSAAEAMTTGVSDLATKLDKLERVTVETTNFKTYSDALRTNAAPNSSNTAATPLSQTATITIGRTAIKDRQILVGPTGDILFTNLIDHSKPLLTIFKVL